MDRSQNISRVRDRAAPWDIVVIGGGATGVGCAVDAAVRGFDVLLLEQHDFGKGTSSRSTKLIHGGVRYLAQGDLSLVRESLRERGLLLQNAPHVVRKTAFIVPCYNRYQKLWYGAGLSVYDRLSGQYSFGKSRVLSREETIDRLPDINKEALRGGVLYYDGQFDDTRLLIDLACTAHAKGAVLLNYAGVTGVRKNPFGKAVGVDFEDAETGEQFSVDAQVIINATGAFCDAVRTLSDANAEPMLSLSQGIHLVFDRSFLTTGSAVVVPKTSDGRVLFVIPWHGHTLIGTTDTPIDRAELEPRALESEIDFVLETAGGYLAKRPTRSDILSVFTGIRPLVRSSKAGNTAALSRDHTIEVDRSGMLTITGGKWTTYRRMAEDAVDRALAISDLPGRPSTTDGLRICGGSEKPGISGGQLHPDLPYVADDIIRAVKNEMARTVEDVLARRTRALFLNARAAIEIAPKAAQIMAETLRKNGDWTRAEAESFRQIATNYLIDAD